MATQQIHLLRNKNYTTGTLICKSASYEIKPDQTNCKYPQMEEYLNAF